MKQIEKQGESNEESHLERVNNHSRNSFTGKDAKKPYNEDEEEEEVNFNEDGSENVESSLADKRNNVPTIKVN